MRFLVYMYYTHPSYQTSIFSKNCAYYIRIFTVAIQLLAVMVSIKLLFLFLYGALLPSYSSLGL